MSSKRLHIHSLPLVGLAVFGTLAVIISVLALRGEPAALALVQPAVRWQQPTEPGAARSGLAPSIPDYEVVELPGLSRAKEDTNQLSNLFPIGGSAESAILYIAIDQAVKVVEAETGR